MPEWQQAIEGEDLLKAYRARELMRLVERVGHIDAMPYDLTINTLDHIEIGIDGNPGIKFLAGMRD